MTFHQWIVARFYLEWYGFIHFGIWLWAGVLVLFIILAFLQWRDR